MKYSYSKIVKTNFIDAEIKVKEALQNVNKKASK